MHFTDNLVYTPLFLKVNFAIEELLLQVTLLYYQDIVWILTVAHSLPVASTSRPPGGGTEHGEEERVGALDVVKAIAPMLIILGLALGMLVLGYLFLPENLSPSFCKYFVLHTMVV